jgi:hypothetical protein
LCIQWFPKLQISQVCIIWANSRRFLCYVNDNFGDQRMSELEYCTLCVWSSCVFLAFDSANFLYNFMLSTTSDYACFVSSLWYTYYRCYACLPIHLWYNYHCSMPIHYSCFVSSVWYNYHRYILETSLFVQSCFIVWPVYVLHNAVLCIFAHTCMLSRCTFSLLHNY